MLSRANFTISPHFLLRRFNFSALSLFCFFLAGCAKPKPFDPSSLTFLIESNPTNLDPRYSTDAQSAHIDALLFNSLVTRDEQMNFHGDLADSWETPDPLTYIFHLHPGVRFHDGRPLTSVDVKATFDFILDASDPRIAAIHDDGHAVEPEEGELEILPFFVEYRAVPTQTVVEPLRFPTDLVVLEVVGLIGSDAGLGGAIDAAGAEALGKRGVNHLVGRDLVREVEPRNVAAAGHPIV